MKDAEDHQTAIAPGGQLRELLEEVNIGPLPRCPFQELAHFVNEHNEAASVVRVPESDSLQRVQCLFFGPSSAAALSAKSSGSDGLLHQPLGTVPTAHNGQDLPSFPLGWHGAPDGGSRCFAYHRRCCPPCIGIRSDQSGQGNHQAGLATAVGAGPSESRLPGFRQVLCHGVQNHSRRLRADESFQDRLVTELRLAGVTTIDEANEVPHRFLPRFNEKFGVPAEHSSVAYRPMESSLFLDQILCFKHRRKVARDNTVKYNWRTLQLLPGKERLSYAGAQMEVHEGLDGQLLVQYRGRTIPTQEAPPRPGVLRASNGALRYGPDPDRRVNGVGNHPKESLTSLGIIEADSATTLNGDGRVRKPPASPGRKPTPRQRVRWKAVQQAELRGLSIRAIARELGIHRNTVRKYAEAKSPPMTRTRGRSRVSQSDGMTAA